MNDEFTRKGFKLMLKPTGSQKKVAIVTTNAKSVYKGKARSMETCITSLYDKYTLQNYRRFKLRDECMNITD